MYAEFRDVVELCDAMYGFCQGCAMRRLLLLYNWRVEVGLDEMEKGHVMPTGKQARCIAKNTS